MTLLTIFVLTACGGGGKSAPPPPPPVITSFTGAASVLTSGESTTLRAVFSGGTGAVDHGIGAVTSGSTVSTGALTASTTYTLTVTNPSNVSTSAQVTVDVVPPPVKPIITAPALVTGNGTGFIASVPAQAGSTYAWTIAGGAITAGGSTNQITFSAGSSGSVQLGCVVTNAAGMASEAGTASSGIVSAPLISSFTSAASTITQGNSTALSFAFAGGVGVVMPGNIAVASGGTLDVSPLTDTTYTLTVTNLAGTPVQAQLAILVVPPPVLTYFSASKPVIGAGGSTLLTAVFTGGTATVDHGIGPINSGTAVSTGVLTASTTFTITITGPGGTVVSGQTRVLVGTLSTFAGVPSGVGNVNGTGAAGRFNSPFSVAVDGSGVVYVADKFNHIIRKVSSGAVVSTWAGANGTAGSDDGTGTGARFKEPKGVAVDALGTVFVADTGNHTIRKITAGGLVSTVAGLAGSPGSADGTGSAARFNAPTALAVDGSGNLYVADAGNHVLRVITPAGLVSTLAGRAGNPGSADGLGTLATFNDPQGLAVDALGIVYVADTGNNTIRRIASGLVSTLAGTAGVRGGLDGTGAAASFYGPTGLVVDSNGVVYVAEFQNSTIRTITPGGAVSTLAGTADDWGNVDGTGSAARFSGPTGLAFDGSGTLHVADHSNNTIRLISAGGVVSTLAGTGTGFGSADGTAEARFNSPYAMAQDGAGNLYVSDWDNHTIRKVTPTGVVSTLAGSAGILGSADGTGPAASFRFPSGLGVDGSGNLYVVDAGNHTIRVVTPSGEVSTLAGMAGIPGYLDATGSAARFNAPKGLVVDASGTVYVADFGNQVIRKITAAGVVSTLAGMVGAPGHADGAGTAASFYGPTGITLDAAGNLYVTDRGNNTIRKVTASGVVSTLAGTAGTTGSADGMGAAARFNGPLGIASDAAGNLYATDIWNSTLRRITPAGEVSTVVGVPGTMIILPGGLPALLAMPWGIAVDRTTEGYFIAVPDAILKVTF